MKNNNLTHVLKKVYLAFLIFFISNIFYSCKKDIKDDDTSIVMTATVSSEQLISEAKAYFSSEVNKTSASTVTSIVNSKSARQLISKEALINNAFIDKMPAGKIVTFPISFKGRELYIGNGNIRKRLSALTFLIVYHDKSGSKHAELVTKLPDDDYLADTSKNKKYSGIITVEGWDGHFIAAYKYSKGTIQTVLGAPEAGNSNKGSNTANSVVKSNDLACYTTYYYSYAVVAGIKGKDVNTTIICCNYIDSEIFCLSGGQGNPAYDNNIYYPIVGEGTTGDGGSVGCGIATGTSIKDGKVVNDVSDQCPPVITVTAIDAAQAAPVNDANPPINVASFKRCFEDGKVASSYKLTLYIDQPVAGKNSQWTLSASGINVDKLGGQIFVTPQGVSIDVGHAFVGFEKHETDGTVVTQVMGFYPGNGFVAGGGVVKDNSQHVYDVSYTITVSESQFNAALNGALTDGGGSNNYNLSNYNCSDAALGWMKAAGANISSASRGIFNNTPGDLGNSVAQIPSAVTGTQLAPVSHGPCD